VTSGKCGPADATLVLPAGFCGSVFADHIGAARHVVVAPNGDVFVTIQGGGPMVALRDVDHDGRADSVVRIGSGSGGTGIGLYGGFLYVDQGSQIVRYPLPSGALRPSGSGQVVVTGLPTDGDHGAHNFAIDAQGNLFVNVGSATNSCQQTNRSAGSVGIDPCTELNTRAGIWRFNADATGQIFSASARYATGLRNSEGLAFGGDGSLWAATHGRDQLFDNWPKLFNASYSAENPGEELVQVNQGDDFGWPYCYYTTTNGKKLVLAPEYGGDGTKTTRCDQKKNAVIAMPGHWAPMSLLLYTGSSFPSRYRDGAFIAFHGSWNRAPQPQAGFRVVFVPAVNGQPSTQYETFADGFAGGVFDPDNAAHRPVGLAQGPSGEIYITDDKAGRVWRVVYAP
jgi:glucose/arabinose dehydrogenase